ncbi:MAG: hydrogenase maturation protease [Actinomycetota bacterium]
MKPRVLVACLGNIFLGDDGFGVEVARRLGAEQFPDWVRVKDFGIRGIHLAYEVLDGYDTLILVDAAPRGEAPGTVYVIEPELARPGPEAPGGAELRVPLIDAHDMEPGSVLALLESLEGQAGRVLVVGCEPADVDEGIGLSEPVTRAVEQAVKLIRELIAEEAKRNSSSRAQDAFVHEPGKEA